MNHAPRHDFDFSPEACPLHGVAVALVSRDNRSSTEGASTPHECRGFLCENDVASASRRRPQTRGNQISAPTPSTRRRDRVSGHASSRSIVYCFARPKVARPGSTKNLEMQYMEWFRGSLRTLGFRVLELHLRHANQSSGMAKELACTPRVSYCVW